MTWETIITLIERSHHSLCSRSLHKSMLQKWLFQMTIQQIFQLMIISSHSNELLWGKIDVLRTNETHIARNSCHHCINHELLQSFCSIEWIVIISCLNSSFFPLIFPFSEYFLLMLFTIWMSFLLILEIKIVGFYLIVHFFVLFWITHFYLFFRDEKHF